MVMRRHTLPLVARRGGLADVESLTLTVHSKPIGHGLLTGHTQLCDPPRRAFIVDAKTRL